VSRQSTADVIAKLALVEEEVDEAIYCMELLIDAGLVRQSRADDLLREIDEILAMTVASIKTLRARNPKSKIQNEISWPDRPAVARTASEPPS
jgi:hypothetical protein